MAASGPDLRIGFLLLPRLSWLLPMLFLPLASLHVAGQHFPFLIEEESPCAGRNFPNGRKAKPYVSLRQGADFLGENFWFGAGPSFLETNLFQFGRSSDSRRSECCCLQVWRLLSSWNWKCEGHNFNIMMMWPVTLTRFVCLACGSVRMGNDQGPDLQWWLTANEPFGHFFGCGVSGPHYSPQLHMRFYILPI